MVAGCANHADMMPIISQEGGIADSKQLFQEVMAGNWNVVIAMYKKSSLARHAKVTRAKHTVLHLAVSEGDDKVVEQLLDAMEEGEAQRILSLQNDFGDTPLHVAASLGLARICWLLAEKCKELVVSARNNARETPLYNAVHHGKKKAFFVLQDCVPGTWMSNKNHPISFCRRGDGNTILHAAVHGEYFDLAVEIVHLYPRLVNFNNEMGQSVLHLLANKPQHFTIMLCRRCTYCHGGICLCHYSSWWCKSVNWVSNISGETSLWRVCNISLFMSIAAMLVSFCAGHFFVMEDRLKYGALPIYIATCFPVTFFAVSQFPLYVDLVKATIADVPERTTDARRDPISLSTLRWKSSLHLIIFPSAEFPRSIAT